MLLDRESRRPLTKQSEAVIHKGTNVATATPFDKLMVAPVSEDSNAPGDKAEFKVSSCKHGLLHDLANRSAGDLSSEEANRLYELLIKFADVFAESSDDMGHAGVAKHSIHTCTCHPIRQQCRRWFPPFHLLPPSEKDDRRYAQEGYHPTIVKSLGISNSGPEKGWISTVLHRLPQVKFCHLERCQPPPPPPPPPPRMDDTLEALSGSKGFSTLDLLCGYWQVEVEEKYRHKTAFCTREGLLLKLCLLDCITPLRCSKG